MELSREIAEELSRRFQAASTDCESSLRVVMAHQSLGEVKVYGGLAASFMGLVFTNLLRPLWQAFPDVEPNAMREPWAEPVPELAPEVKVALQSFAASANAALLYAQQVLSRNSSELEFDGLSEIEAAVRQIQAFIEHPRFR